MKLKRKFLQQLLRQALHYSMKKKSFPNFLSNSMVLEVAQMRCEAVPCEYDANSRWQVIAVNRTRPCLIRATSALSLHKSWINSRFDGATYGDNQYILCSILLILWTMLYSGIKIICIVCSWKDFQCTFPTPEITTAGFQRTYNDKENSNNCSIHTKILVVGFSLPPCCILNAFKLLVQASQKPWCSYTSIGIELIDTIRWS